MIISEPVLSATPPSPSNMRCELTLLGVTHVKGDYFELSGPCDVICTIFIDITTRCHAITQFLFLSCVIDFFIYFMKMCNCFLG